MAVFCEFYHMTPDEFWDLDLADYDALGRLIERRAKEQEKG